jgi:phosphatidate cytidylyltransferase
MSGSEDAITLRLLLYWLLFPALAFPVHLVMRARGGAGFLGRILVWLAIIPLFVVSSHLGPWPFAAVLATSCTVACRELARLIGRGRAAAGSFAVALALSLPWLALAAGGPGWRLAVPALLAMVPTAAYPWLARTGSGTGWAAALGCGVGASLAFWVLLERLPGGAGLVAFAFSVVVVNDMMSFVSGLALGRWRPFPRLSPSKTLAGYLLGAATAVLAAYAIAFAAPGFGVLQIGGGALLLAVSGALGDLLASAVKRRSGAKDFGTFLGPMGGMLDRLDSLLGAGWVFYAFTRLVLS